MCRQGHFRCLNGECILAVYKCDGHSDCGDESDELDCPMGEFPLNDVSIYTNYSMQTAFVRAKHH